MAKFIKTDDFFKALGANEVTYCVYASTSKKKLRPILLTPSVGVAMNSYAGLTGTASMMSSLCNGVETIHHERDTHGTPIK